MVLTKIYRTILLVFLSNSVFVVGQTIEYDKLTLQGLSFYSKKDTILQVLGNPIEIKEPNYECGALSSEWQSVAFYQLIFDGYIFTGNDSYLIEKINFEINDNINLNYKGHTLNSRTSIADAKEIFGVIQLQTSRSDNLNKEVFLNGIHMLKGEPTFADDGIILTFKNDQLVRFEYWSSC